MEQRQHFLYEVASFSQSGISKDVFVCLCLCLVVFGGLVFFVGLVGWLFFGWGFFLGVVVVCFLCKAITSRLLHK